MVNNGVFVTCC